MRFVSQAGGLINQDSLNDCYRFVLMRDSPSTQEWAIEPRGLSAPYAKQ